MKTIGRAALAAWLLLCVLTLPGCGQEQIDSINALVPFQDDGASSSSPSAPAATPAELPPKDYPVPFTVALPDAPGSAIESNEKAVIDYSNASDGYVMVMYTQAATMKLKVLVDGPNETQYAYDLTPGEYEVFPLSEGDGSYTVGVYEQLEGSRYALATAVTTDVTLTDQFAPFVRPNQYVNYNADSDAVRMAAFLTEGAAAPIDKVTSVYSYVTSSIVYDREFAALPPPTGYLPDVDEVLQSGSGICFDYAALMASMLRCQGIPAKIIVGYTGELYHAWNSVFLEEEGWVDGVILFDGQNWQLMDPTLAANGHSKELLEYIGDGSNYTPLFQY
jgi:transglutaminase-like putative cysteine protease